MTDLKVKADLANNRLHFSFAGNVTKSKLESIYTDTRFLVADLRPGFDVISDFSECTLLHLDAVPTFKRIMSYLIENELGEIVRVIRDNNVSYKQILNLALRVQGYKPIYVSTYNEAVKTLESVVRRKGVRVRLHRSSIEYLTEGKHATGRIVDMSVSGCAVVYDSEPSVPKLDTEIRLKFALRLSNDMFESFRIKARVVRKEPNLFAAHFLDLDEEKKELLGKCLLYESRR